MNCAGRSARDGDVIMLRFAASLSMQYPDSAAANNLGSPRQLTHAATRTADPRDFLDVRISANTTRAVEH